jgi:NTE family protein
MGHVNEPPAPRVALSLPGGGPSGALYQVGALAALGDHTGGLGGFALYLGNAGGSVVAACLAAGVPIDRIYRGLLDPADDFFPLDRRTVLRVDVDEWRRMSATTALTIKQALWRMLPGRAPLDEARVQDLVVDQVDRFADSLPAGLFSLDRFERFVADFFLRRDVPNVFTAMPRPLRVAAHDLDSSARVLFGSPGFDQVPVSLACAASCALPIVFSPVRIGGRHYVDGGLCRTAHLDAAQEAGCDLMVVISPRVPASSKAPVPTGHGPRSSVRDKGFLWVYNQARRISARAQLEFEVAAAPPGMTALVLEPEPEDTPLFMQGTATPESRRAMLEYAYRTTRQRLGAWLGDHPELAERMGWR